MVRKTNTFKRGRKLKGGQGKSCLPGTSGCLPGNRGSSFLGRVRSFFSRRKSPNHEAVKKANHEAVKKAAENANRATRRAAGNKKRAKVEAIAKEPLYMRWTNTVNAMKKNVKAAKDEMNTYANRPREVLRLRKEIAELEKGLAAAEKEMMAVREARIVARDRNRIAKDREAQRAMAAAYGYRDANNLPLPPPSPPRQSLKASLKTEAKLPEVKTLVAAREELDKFLDASTSRTRYLNTPAKAAQRSKIIEKGQKIIDEYLEALKAAEGTVTATEEKHSAKSQVQAAESRLKSV